MEIKKIKALALGGYAALISLIILIINIISYYFINKLLKNVLNSVLVSVLAQKTILILIIVIVNFLTWVIIALFYNLIASRIGGLQIDIEK